MKRVLFKSVPFIKNDVTQALEQGVDGLIVPSESAAVASVLARCDVIEAETVSEISLEQKEDEADASRLLDGGNTVLLRKGWEVIPVENLLAHTHVANSRGCLALSVEFPEQALLAAGILEKGVDSIVVTASSLSRIGEIVSAVKSGGGTVTLEEAVIEEIRPVGVGHRVCVDTLSLLKTGQGMLVGNSASFTFLVNAETEHNEYVASRPFRVNAGAVHCYAMMPEDRTVYLEELKGGENVLVVDHTGVSAIVVAGRIKTEKRPMLFIAARVGEKKGTVFLQNAETIRLVRPGGEPVSVVALVPGDRILCHTDTAGRHFGMRINEEIRE